MYMYMLSGFEITFALFPNVEKIFESYLSTIE